MTKETESRQYRKWQEPGYREKMKALQKNKNSGVSNNRWKGDDVGYTALHHWVKKWKGETEACEKCGVKKGEAILNWANIDHKYRRVLDDFICLCVKCHWDYDKKHNER